jgi:DNA-nicking Smr family endonuclease
MPQQTRYTLADLKVVKKRLAEQKREAEAARLAAIESARLARLAEQHAVALRVATAADLALFHAQLAGVTPLPVSPYAPPSWPKAEPIPKQRLADEERVVGELLKPVSDWETDLETGESLTFLRQGLPRDLLRKLRRGHWVVQAVLDLHGLNREEARIALGEFLAKALTDGHRCVRVIHGKGLGSHMREPVLKHKVKRYLQQREEVLGFVEARNVDGGGGAVMVLLKGGVGTRN